MEPGNGSERPHLPPPTLWPVGFAIGIACILIGLVVSWPAVAVGGAIAIVFGFLWARDVLAGHPELRVAPAVGGGPFHSRTSASTAGTARRISSVASRAQRKPKTTAITAPADDTQTGLTIRPTRMTAMPMANPMGQSVGDGPCSGGPGVIPSSRIRS